MVEEDSQLLQGDQFWLPVIPNLRLTEPTGSRSESTQIFRRLNHDDHVLFPTTWTDFSSCSFEPLECISPTIASSLL